MTILLATSLIYYNWKSVVAIYYKIKSIQLSIFFAFSNTSGEKSTSIDTISK